MGSHPLDDDDDDDDDFLSVSSSNEGDDDNNGHGGGPLTVPHQEYNSNDNDDERSVEVVEVVAGPGEPRAPLHVVDMTVSSPPRPTRPNCRRPRSDHNNNNNNKASSEGDLRRCKRAAKKYKGLYKQKDSQCRELNLQRQSLIELHSSIKEENKKLREEQEARQELSELRNAQLDAANLKVVRLADDLKQIQGQIRDLTRERNEWNAKHDELQRSFKKEVQRVKSSDMAEVQQMMEERSKLLAENERLIRECAAALRRESKVMSVLRQAAATASKPPSSSDRRDDTRNPLSRIPLSLAVSVPDKKRKASTIAKDLRGMDNARFPHTAETASSSRDLEMRLSSSSKMSARSGSLMEKVRQQQQQLRQQSLAASTSKAQTGAVLSDDTNRPILTESVRRVSLESAEQQKKSADEQPRTPSLGLKVSKSNNLFFRTRR